MKTKKSVLLLIALILGAAYLAYVFVYFGGMLSSDGSDTEVIAAGLASVLVGPHIFATLIAVVFNALGYFLNRRGFALTGGILYIVAGALFIPYIVFVIIQAILSFVAYAKIKKIA